MCIRDSLYVVLHVRPHDLFVRDGDDLLCEVPIPFHVAALGGTVDVPTIAGKAEVRIPPGTQSGTVFRLKGKGVPSVRGYGRGDHNVRVLVEVPTGLSGDQRRQLEQFGAGTDDRIYPRLRAFLKKAKKFTS